MYELKYYYDEEHDVLSVYNRETEFFRAVFPCKKRVGKERNFLFAV